MRPSHAFVLLCVLSAGAASAQSLTGRLSGTVRDSQGGVLPGATVTLSGRTGSLQATADPGGQYRFPAVDPGSYELQAEFIGLRAQRREGVVVAVGSHLTIDFSLAPAVVAAVVDVVAATDVDVTSAATSATISQDQLFRLPLPRDATLLANLAPGINNLSAYGGGATTSNAMLLDGVDTRDMSDGTPALVMNYNVVEEVQIQGLGAPAEYGGFTGGIVNVLTRSGGNAWRGLFDALATTSKFASNNVSPAVAARNPALAASADIHKLLDFTAQLGGPIRKDKLFLFANVQRYELDSDPPGPTTQSDELDHRVNLKLTWLPGAKDHFVAMFQADHTRSTGVAGVPPLLATDDLTGESSGPEVIWNGQYRRILGSQTLLEVKYVGWSSHTDFTPKVNGSLHYDLVTHQYSGAAGFLKHTEKSREQGNVSVSHYAQAFGQHDLKFGVEIERGRGGQRLSYVGGYKYYDAYGAPYLAASFGYDVAANNARETAFAQDAWKPSPRWTINAGLRFDWDRGSGPQVGKVFDTKSLAPRLGLAFDLAGDHKSVLKASYGRYHESLLARYYGRANAGVRDFVTYAVTPVGLMEVDRFPSPRYPIDPGIKQPRVDEWTAGFERALSASTRFAVIGVYRTNRNFIDSILPTALWAPVQVTNLLTNQPLTVYRWANRDQSQGDRLITNIDGFVYRDAQGRPLGAAEASRKYRALIVSLDTSHGERWHAMASYVLSKADGATDNTFGPSVGLTSNYEFATRALVNGFGAATYDRRHEFKVLASYQIPKLELGVSAFYRAISGLHYTPFQELLASDLNVPGPTLAVLLEAMGSRTLPVESYLDMRVEKVFKLGAGERRLGVYADIRNVFNADTTVAAQSEVPSVQIPGVQDAQGNPVPILFGAPTAIAAPRQLLLGARYTF
jgi:hypothetical protein